MWTVSSGEEVALTLDNQGGVEHSWTVLTVGTTVPVPFDRGQNLDMLEIDSGLVAAGEQQTFRFIAPASGEYTVICTVSGHYPLMQGRLVVQ